jgi:two-component system NtrC family sensor kinase
MPSPAVPSDIAAPLRQRARGRTARMADWRKHLPSPDLLIQILALVILVGWYGKQLLDLGVNLDVPGRSIALDGTARMFLDPERRFTLDSLRTGEGRQSFEREAIPYESVGLTSGYVWIRLDLQPLTLADHPGRGPQSWYLEFSRAAMTFAELHLIHPVDGRVETLTADTRTPVSQRQVQHVSSVFDIRIDPDHLPEAWLQLANDTPLYGNITVWDPSLFYRKVAAEEALYGIFYGGMLILFLYNLCMYFSMRQTIYVHYLGYLAGVSLGYFMSNGHFLILLANEDWDSLKKTLPFLIFLTFLFVFLFTREFLETKRYHPTADKVILLLSAGLVASIIATPFIDFIIADHASLLLSSTLVPIVFGIAAYTLLKRNRNARFFLLAWSFNLTGGAVFIALSLGMLPSTPLVKLAFPAGILIEALLLSFSLADKIKRAQEDVEKARQRALGFARRYRKLLEAKVEERTQHLVNTQQQLVTQQKMAALGVLTSGVAQEINHPTRQIRTGVQQLNEWRNSFRQLIDELLDEDTDPEIRQMFDERFRKFGDQLDIIQTGGKRINAIVKGLRTITRLEDSERRMANVVEGLTQTLALIKPNLGGDIDFVTDIHDSPMMRCWPTDLNSAFMSILNNAILAIRDKQAADTPSLRGRIRVTSRSLRGAQGQELFISIEDNGVGMPKDVAERAFDPFFTTRTVGAGAGLGLSTTREIIEKHGGKVSLSSTEGDGTSVIILLPVDRQ